MTASLLDMSSLWIWIVLLLLLVGIFVLVVLSGLVRKPEPKPTLDLDPKGGGQPPPPPAEGDKAPAPAPGAQQAESKPAGPLAFLRRGGPADPVVDSFARGVAFLRNEIPGPNYRYQLPWYLVIGDPACGKTSMISALGSNLWSEGRIPNPKNPVHWHFHDQGVLLRASGRYFKSVGNEAPLDWGRLLHVLQDNRPRRPLDGIVLAIPASELVGASALDESDIMARANKYSEMLAQAQRILGFSFPVYVVVTKCDSVEGFRDFSGQLPVRTRDNMVGWSNSYHVDAAFSSQWIGEAFDAASRELQSLQSEIFVEKADVANPDRVFLFPENFARMRDPLQFYLERLFRETAYRESFRLRGIYFCGSMEDPVKPAPALPPVSEASMEEGGEWRPAPPADPAPAMARAVSPIFVRDLFERKIFPEAGVSRPVSTTLLARSRAVRLIQIWAAILSVVLIIGMIVNYRKLAGYRDILVPVFREMNSGRTDPVSLIKQFYEADDAAFTSYFIPASWFSSVEDDATNGMAYGCSKWILRQLLPAKLQSKQREILASLSRTDQLQSDKDDQDRPEKMLIADYTESPYYSGMKQLVDSLSDLEQNLETYRNLAQAGQGDNQHINKMLSYIGLADVQPHGHLAVALRRASGDEVTITDELRSKASKRLVDLVNGMFEQWTEDNALIEDLEQTRMAVAALDQVPGRRDFGPGGQNGNGLIDRLRTARVQLGQLSADMLDRKFAWTTQTQIRLSESVFRNPIALPHDPPILGIAMEKGQQSLDNLRLRLQQSRTLMTDAILTAASMRADSQGRPDAVIRLSDKTLALQTALENTLNLRFMTDNGGDRRLQTQLGADQRLMWKVEPLQEALKIFDVFNEYDRLGLPISLDSLRGPLRRLAVEQLRRYDEDLIASAQNFTSLSVPLTSMGAEDETVLEVKSFNNAALPLMQLANLFKSTAPSVHDDIVKVMEIQAFHLLTQLNDRLRKAEPYRINPRNWEGRRAMSLDMFNAKSAGVLFDYLGGQREGIRFLSRQAEPLVTFILAEMPLRNSEQNALVNTWKGIIDDFKQYDDKRPTASIAQLEDFVTHEMDKISESCGGNKDPDPSADFFLGRINDIRTEAISRCRDVTAGAVCVSYSHISTVFNQRLAGKYPFAAIPAGRIQNEPDASDILAFYQVFDKELPMANRLNFDQLGDVGQKAALQFLGQMQTLRELAIPTGAEVQKEPPFTFDFSPQLRSNRTNESGGNQIVDWTLQVGKQFFQLRQPERNGRWRVGDPVRLALRWANDSAYVPVIDGSPNLRVLDRNAFFEFPNKWSLLTFLTRHDAVLMDPQQTGGQIAYLLRFQVKTVLDPKWTSKENYPPTGSTSVYVQLRILPAGGKSSIAFPVFPQAAPDLGNFCKP